jgi:two-component sensor histidine kinase
MLLYLLFWVPIAALLGALLSMSGGFGWADTLLIVSPLTLLFAFVCLSPWSLCRVLPLGPGKMGRILRSHLSAAVVAGFFWIIAAKGWGMLLSRWQPTLDGRLSHALPTLFLVGLLLYILATSLHYVLLSFQASREAEMQAHRSQMLARDAELRALKAQINPHFLFNSLNSISALTMLDGAKAREMCIHLSDFLRSTLSLGDKETITFEEELALTQTYLKVEQIRFGSRLRVRQDVGPACGACRVPPLLMQPLVENAIKHGIAGLIDGGEVSVEAHCGDGTLVLRVGNEFDPDAPVPRRSGHGLANVRNRLQTRYDNRARLDTQVTEGTFLVELTLPCEESAHA